MLDEVALWSVDLNVGQGGVISAAVDALVAGLDSPSLRELAGLSDNSLYWTVRPLVEATLEELDLALPESGADALQIAAARAMSRRLLRGTLTTREFTIWAHRVISHEGAERLQSIVLLDDIYDDVAFAGANVGDLDEVARREAASLLAGEPLLVGIEPMASRERAPRESAGSRLRAVSLRFRARLRR